MSASRWRTLLGLVVAIGGAASTLGHLIPGETGVVIVALGAAIATFNERLHGGSSIK